MFPEGNMTRYTQTLGDRIPAAITFVFNTISKKATKSGARFMFGKFIRL
jgi:hypothetical protein